MKMGKDIRSAALERLDVFTGTWQLEASFPQAPDAESPDDDAFAVFEWALGGRFLIQRTKAPDPAPDNFSQRFSGTFRGDGKAIVGRWEISHDGERWEHDFDLTYMKLG